MCSCRVVRWEDIYSKFIINMQNSTDDSSSSDQVSVNSVETK